MDGRTLLPEEIGDSTVEISDPFIHLDEDTLLTSDIGSQILCFLQVGGALGCREGDLTAQTAHLNAHQRDLGLIQLLLDLTGFQRRGAFHGEIRSLL